MPFRRVTSVRSKVLGSRVDSRLNPQSGGAAARGGRAQNLPVERLSPEMGCRWMFPDDADGAILKCGIRQRLNPKNFGKWLIAGDSDFEREPPGGRVVRQVRVLMGIDGAEGKPDGVAGDGLRGVGDAPSAVVPISQFHPAGKAAAQHLVFGQVLLRPMAAPVFEADFKTCRNGVGEVHRHRMYFARVVPLQPVPVRQRHAERRGIKKEGRGILSKGRANRYERGEKDQSEPGIHVIDYEQKPSRHFLPPLRRRASESDSRTPHQ